MSETAMVERTYQALMGVVHTTAVSRKVLVRPPFTFLHKLLVETLGEYELFSEQQLQFSAMTTKQAKVRQCSGSWHGRTISIDPSRCPRLLS
jgi:predicted component of type VI protein secretion system